MPLLTVDPYTPLHTPKCPRKPLHTCACKRPLHPQTHLKSQKWACTRGAPNFIHKFLKDVRM